MLGMDIYASRTAGFRKLEQQFVSWATACLGKPVMKQRLSHGRVETIAAAYDRRALKRSLSQHAHSTTGMATSWALFQGVSDKDVRVAATWVTAHTFSRFYVTAPTLSHIIVVVPKQRLKLNFSFRNQPQFSET